MKKWLISFALVIMMFAPISCGGFSSQSKQPTGDSKPTSLKEVQSDNQDAEQEEVTGESGRSVVMLTKSVSETTEKEEKVIADAEPFSNGYAWIRIKGESGENGWKWKCIDINGKVVFERECQSVSSFINGYAIVDKSIVIDSAGNELYDISAEGYELIDTQPLDVGCIILSKDIDTYEKSGTFSYVLDLEKKTVTEIDLSGCAYYTASKKWGEFYQQYSYQSVGLLNYLGRGYYTLGLKEFDKFKDDYPSSFRMIQWYDVKNNRYIDIDSGVEFQDEDLPYALIYFKTKNPDVYCVYFTQKDKIYFIDINTCLIVKTVDGFMPCSGYYSKLTDVYPEDYLAFCADSQRVWNGRDEGELWYLDFNTQEKFQMTPEYEEFEIITYNGDYFCLSLKNDIGTYYLAVVDKNGETVYSPVKYDHNSKFKPCFWGDHLIYYVEGEMCFVSMVDWKTETRVAMEIVVKKDANKSMCVMDVDAPDVKYIVDFNTNSFYLPDGSAAAINMERSPTMASPGIFESKILMFEFYEQAHSFLNNDLTDFVIQY